MLKHRLFFGSLMILFFVGVNVLDGRLDGSISESVADSTVQGTILYVLILILSIPAQIELAGMFERTGSKIFKPIAIAGTMLLVSSWYWPQFVEYHIIFFYYPLLYFYQLFFVLVFLLLGIFLWQGFFLRHEKCDG